MASDVILFGECSGMHFLENDYIHRNYIKSSAVLRLGHFLRRRGHKVFQVHHFTSFSTAEIEALVRTHVDKSTKVLGISSTFISPVKIKTSDSQNIEPICQRDFDRIHTVLTVAKELNPNIKIVMGGPHTIKLRLQKPKDMVRWRFDEIMKNVDYTVQEQGEVSLAMLVEGIEPPYEEIAGVKHIDGSLLPIVDFSLVANAPAPVIDGVKFGEALSTELAHGCIFNCEFCGHGRVLGKKVREYSRSYENLKKEITYNYEKFGTSMYMFLDDMVNDDPNKVEWLIQIKEETGIPLEWVSYARLDVIKTEQQAEKLLKSGCRGIYFGIESMKTDVGPKIGKVTDREKIVNSLKMVRKVFGDDAFIKVSMIGGLPGETQDEFKSSINWMLHSEEGQHLIDRVSITPLVVYREDKGSVSASRNYPFAMYQLNEQMLNDYSAPPDWVSPWGTRTEFAKLIGSLYTGVNQAFHNAHPFYFPMYHSFGIKLADFIKSYRNRTFTSNPTNAEIHSKCTNLINEYKRTVLSLTHTDVDNAHQEFWLNFPIERSELQSNVKLITFFKSVPNTTI